MKQWGHILLRLVLIAIGVQILFQPTRFRAVTGRMA
jgi:hypothetical protein